MESLLTQFSLLSSHYESTEVSRTLRVIHDRSYPVNDHLNKPSPKSKEQNQGNPCETAAEYQRTTASGSPNLGLFYAVLPTKAHSVKDVIGSQNRVIQPLDMGGSALAATSGMQDPTSRKRPYQALREFPIPTYAASFRAAQSVGEVDGEPNQLYYLDGKGSLKKRKFSPVRKLDYTKRLRYGTPSPAPSSDTEIDPDSPTLLKAKRIEAKQAEASRKGFSNAATPQVAPPKPVHAAIYQPVHRPRHPVYLSSYSYRTPSPRPELRDDEDCGTSGIVHFSAPSWKVDGWASDDDGDDGVLHFGARDQIDEEVEAGDDDAEAHGHALAVSEDSVEGEDDVLEVKEDPFSEFYDENGDLLEWYATVGV